jgi:hypothetical protein
LRQVLFAFSLALAGPAYAAQSGLTTINLRTCVDGGDAACLTVGDVAVDGVRVCLRQPDGAEHCYGTEDGEAWVDSLPQRSYCARVEVPFGYQLGDSTCTTYPDIPYSPCRSTGSVVHFTVRPNTNAVNVSFLLIPD